MGFLRRNFVWMVFSILILVIFSIFGFIFTNPETRSHANLFKESAIDAFWVVGIFLFGGCLGWLFKMMGQMFMKFFRKFIN